jgi:hypothetical protein
VVLIAAGVVGLAASLWSGRSRSSTPTSPYTGATDDTDTTEEIR